MNATGPDSMQRARAQIEALITLRNERLAEKQAAAANGPAQADVDALRDLLDITDIFASSDQRARYLLSSDWMRAWRGDRS